MLYEVYGLDMKIIPDRTPSLAGGGQSEIPTVAMEKI
jgi:hypothetical protein